MKGRQFRSYPVLYRDGGNNKQWGTLVLDVPADGKQRFALVEQLRHDGEQWDGDGSVQFIPDDVHLDSSALVDGIWDHDPDLDHPWLTLYPSDDWSDVVGPARAASGPEPMTLETLALRFRLAKAAGWPGQSKVVNA